jgi:hypothetical protein
MKKLMSISAVSIFTIFLSLSFTDCFSQGSKTATKPSCVDTSESICQDSVTIYAAIYKSIVSANPANTVQQINFTNPELSCLSKLSSDGVKFIFAAYDTDPLNIFIVVEVKKKGKYYFYDLDKLFPSGRKRGTPSNHFCPPPTPCPIPYTLK